MKAKTIDGQDILTVRSLKSMYDQGCVAVFDDHDNEFRLPMDVIATMVKTFRFVPLQKRKYVWLVKAVKKHGK